MSPLDRRELLELAAVAAGATVLPSACSSSDPGPNGRTLAGATGATETLAAWLANPTTPSFAADVVKRMNDGLTIDGLYEAAFHASTRRFGQGVTEHSALALDAARTLAGDDRATAIALLVAIRGVEDWFLDWYATNLGEIEAYDIDGAEGGEAELASAIAAHEEAAAERAAVNLFRTLSPAALTEVLWRVGIRDFSAAGHRQIGIAQLRSRPETEVAVRALARRLAQANDGPNEGATDDFERNRGVTTNPGWLDAPQRDEDTATLIAELPGLDSAAAAAAVRDRLGTVSPDAIWDALVLRSLDRLTMGGPEHNGLNLHCFTAIDAMRTGFTTVTDPALKLLILLQAASYYAWFPSKVGAGGAASLTELDPSAMPTVQGYDEALGLLGSGRLEGDDGPTVDAAQQQAAAVQIAALARSSADDGTAIRGAVTRLLSRTATDLHHIKFAYAVLNEAPRIAPTLRPNLLAALAFYSNGPDGDPIASWTATDAALADLDDR